MTQPVIVPSLREAFAYQPRDESGDRRRRAGCAAHMRRTSRDCRSARAYVTRSLPEFVEVLDPTVDKGAALAVRCRAARHSDGRNHRDRRLLERRAAAADAAGLRHRDGLGAAGAARLADAVVGDVAHDGVAEAIEKYVLAACHVKSEDDGASPAARIRPFLDADRILRGAGRLAGARVRGDVARLRSEADRRARKPPRRRTPRFSRGLPSRRTSASGCKTPERCARRIEAIPYVDTAPVHRDAAGFDDGSRSASESPFAILRSGDDVALVDRSSARLDTGVPAMSRLPVFVMRSGSWSSSPGEFVRTRDATELRDAYRGDGRAADPCRRSSDFDRYGGLVVTLHGGCACCSGQENDLGQKADARRRDPRTGRRPANAASPQSTCARRGAGSRLSLMPRDALVAGEVDVDHDVAADERELDLIVRLEPSKNRRSRPAGQRRLLPSSITT